MSERSAARTRSAGRLGAATPGWLELAVGGRAFVLSIEFVREVVETPPITPVPFAPDVVAGVAEVRGSIVPVLDLGLYAGEAPASRGGRMVVAGRPNGSEAVALLADDVTRLLALDVRPEPETVLDIDRLLAPEGLV